MINRDLFKRYIQYSVLGIAVFSVIIIPFILLKNNLFVVSSNSMYPTLKIGDLIYAAERNPANIKANEKDGDILVIRGPNYYYENELNPIFLHNLENNTPIIHRAIDKRVEDNKYYFLMKGDNNLLVDGGYKLLNYSENGDFFLVEYNEASAIYVSEDELLGVVQYIIPFIGYIKIFFTYFIIPIGIIVICSICFKLMGYRIQLVKKES